MSSGKIDPSNELLTVHHVSKDNFKGMKRVGSSELPPR